MLLLPIAQMDADIHSLPTAQMDADIHSTNERPALRKALSLVLEYSEGVDTVPALMEGPL